MDEASVRRGLDKARKMGILKPYLVPDLPGDIVLEQAPEIAVDYEHGGLIVASDLHVPLFSTEWTNRVIETAREEGIPRLLLGGDFWNMDALSRFENDQGDAGLEREWRDGQIVMQKLLETFEEITVLWGNHDHRFARALGLKIKFAAAMEMLHAGLGEELLSRIRFTNLDHAKIWTPRGEWHVCHPESYTKTPLSNAREMADIFECNVMTAHSHHMAVGHAKNGRYLAVELGGLFDASKTAYLQRSTRYPRWTNGFVWLDEDGLLHLEAAGLG